MFVLLLQPLPLIILKILTNLINILSSTEVLRILLIISSPFIYFATDFLFTFLPLALGTYQNFHHFPPLPSCNPRYKSHFFIFISHLSLLAFKTSLLSYSLKLSSHFLSMEMPRTPDLPTCDIIPPPMDALRCFRLAETEDVPLVVDSTGHIRGAVTGEVSTHLFYFLHLSCKLGLG